MGMQLKADVISDEMMLLLTQYSPMAHMINVQDFMITSVCVLISEVKKDDHKLFIIPDFHFQTIPPLRWFKVLQLSFILLTSSSNSSQSGDSFWIAVSASNWENQGQSRYSILIASVTCLDLLFLLYVHTKLKFWYCSFIHGISFKSIKIPD